jgi:hypothetical protein
MHQHHLKRHLVNRAAAWSAEQLEQRTLLSGGVFDVSNVPTYVPTSTDISDVKNGPLGNFGSHLAGLYTEYKRFVKDGGDPAKFRSKTETLLQYNHGKVAVTVRTRGNLNDLATRLQQYGSKLIYKNGIYNTIDAWVPVDKLSTIARDTLVLNAHPVFKAQTSQQGVANNQGDLAMNADSGRSTFGVNGSGVKVGVLSDSVNAVGGGLADSVATGDLPKNVQVIQDSFGTDEGRAMLEQIHDIAPGASLAFATADPTPSIFAHNIVQLVRAGCNVIVDDVHYLDEPFFQEGVISQAITDAAEKHNVSYFSSVGNQAFSGFSVPAHFVKDINGRLLQDFDPTEKVDTRMRITVSATSTFTFGWSNPYNGVVGAATTDLDINFIDPFTGQIVETGNEANLATGSPVEVVGVPAGVYDVEIAVADRMDKTKLPTMIKFTTDTDIGINDPEFKIKGARTSGIGHNSGLDTISVGAVPFFDAPPFNNNKEIKSEDFSSSGTLTYLFKQNGDPLTKPMTVKKPDISAIDGVNTSFFGFDVKQDPDALPNFFGTSAAAPNAAAVAALMYELKPDATPAEIKNALVESAKQNPVNGQPPGSFDERAGFGLIDAQLALHFLDPSTVVADIGRGVPDTVPTGVDKLSIQFTDPVTGFDLSDLELVRGKDSTKNLLVGSNAKLTTTDNQNFVLSGLGPLTHRRGEFFLRFKPVNVFDRKTKSIPAINGVLPFFVTGQPTGLVALPVSDHQIDLSWTDNTAGEVPFVVRRALDDQFTIGVQVFNVNVAHFKDTTVQPTTQYFYRVHAKVNDKLPNPSTPAVNAFSLAANETVVDNRTPSTAIQGPWTLKSDPTNAFGGDFLMASPTGISKSVTFTPNLADAGNYFIYVHSIKASGNATNVSVELLSDGDVKEHFTIDERTNNGYIFLGSFKLSRGTSTSVRIRTTGANGTVVADSVRFQRTSTA